jgi:parvulin-like peptidyl-prolyl isomerase
MKTIRALLFRLLLAFAMAQVLPAALAVESDLVDAIYVVVHDSVITRHEVAVLTFPAIEPLSRQYRGEELQRRVAQTEHDNMEQLVNRQLILHEFKTAGYNLPESVIDEMVRTRIRADFGDEMTLTRTLQARGITKEQFREQIRDQFIVRALREKNISSEIIISPHKMQLYYEQHTNDFGESDKVKVRMIMLNKSSEEELAQVKGRAEEILTRLKEGADFAEMAKLYSQDSYRNQGGEHGWIEQKVLGKELAEACSTLKPRQTSDVVETKEACWLIQMEEKNPAHTKPLSEVRDQIEKNLLQDEQKRLEAQWIERLKKKTYIKSF